ncbi:hypothetical protein BST61_g9289 [Cercospora zeina]
MSVRDGRSSTAAATITKLESRVGSKHELQDFEQPSARELDSAVSAAPQNVGPTGLKFWAIISAAFAAMFLVNLDKLIISTAIPQITHTFKTPDDIGWYGTAYLLTNCAFQLFFGKLYKFLPTKSLFIATTLIFQAGSLLCGVAPTSLAFILGRTLAGLGAGGVLPGVVTIIAYAVPMARRPKYMGGFGAIYGFASILGPTVGGAFTTHVTWRWCFYINLPIGGVIIALMLVFLDLPDKSQPTTLREKLWQCNPLGTACMVAGITCLCLALQWGGMKYAWSDVRLIVLLVLAGVLLLVFAIVQVWLPKQAILPPSVALQRSIAAGFWCSICIGAHQTIFLYYLPTWMQTVKGLTAVNSGLALLAMAVPTALIAVGTGQLISRVGYYTPFLIAGSCICALGSGLFDTFRTNTETAKWIGYLILYGSGLGFVSQVPSMAAQTVLAKENVAIGSSMMFFGQTLFGAIFVSVGQNVLYADLVKDLSRIPGIDAHLIWTNGITDVLNRIPASYYYTGLQMYNEALRTVFRVGLVMACLGVIGSLFLEWKSVQKSRK